LQASLQKELDAVQQSLVSKHEVLAKAKMERAAQELQAKSQHAIRFESAPIRHAIDGGTEHGVFAVPEARKRKHPAVSFHPDAMALFAPRAVQTAVRITSNTSVASDNTSLFWSDITPAQANTCIPSRTVPSNVRDVTSTGKLKVIDRSQCKDPKSKPKMRVFDK